MKFNQTAIQYCVELTVEEFLKITDKERECENDGTWYSLAIDLDKIDGIQDTDYNGHFGPNIFYTHDLEHEVNQDDIRKVIEKWIM